MAVLRVSDVVAAMDGLFPPSAAQSWDRVGLAVGDVDAAVTRIGFAVDPCEATVAEAIERGAQLLVTHHPLYLRGTHAVTSATGKGRWTMALVREGIGLFSAHTNADVAASTSALAGLLGVRVERPLDEETGIGGVGELEEAMTLAAFAAKVGEALPKVPAGVLAAGDPEREVRRVALCSGAGDSLLEEANAAGADVFLTADLRHHPATDHLWNSGCALVCATHWASEWPLLGEMARRLAESLGPSAPDVYVSKIPTDPWNIVVRQ